MIGSTCTGYAGLDSAVARVFGEEVAWFVESADAPARLLAHHWPHIVNHLDATAVDWSTVAPITVLCGGYPCQPFSLAGRRQGAEDERHVWPFLAAGEVNAGTGRIVRAGALAVLRPRFAVFENVAGHLTLGFDQVLADLHELGYDAWWTLWRASTEGAPHRRERLFVLAVRREMPARLPRRAALIARHDPEHLWVTADDGLFGAVPFTGKIPPTGAQVTGRIYALPPPVATAPTGLLPTPRTTDCHGAGVHGNGGMDLRTAVTLLPTPISRDPQGRRAYGDAPGRPLSEAVHALLPTPVTDPDTGNGHARNLGAEAARMLLPTHRVAATRTSRSAATRADSRSAPSLDQAIELAHGVVPREFADTPEEMPASWQAALLPTPQARDGDRGSVGASDVAAQRRLDDGRRNLDDAVATLLPTPRATDGTKGGPNQRGSSGDMMLPSAAVQAQANWGVYGPAVRRWETVLGRPAPAPTMTGVRGGQQLSPAFVEWMQGLPAGHVTGVPGLSRAQQLKLLGNGVCPAQAVAALRWLTAVAGVAPGRMAA